jgi:hypothetical protein
MPGPWSAVGGSRRYSRGRHVIGTHQPSTLPRFDPGLDLPGRAVALGIRGGATSGAAPARRSPRRSRVRFSGVPSAASASAISSMECPAARSSRMRARAVSLAWEVFGPGLPETKNSRPPARKSRTADSNDAGV